MTSSTPQTRQTQADMTKPATGTTPMVAPSQVDLGMYGSKDRQMGVRLDSQVGPAIITFLRRRHPVKLIDCVAAETGIPPKTIAKWIERENVPSGLALLRLIMAYGPDFLVSIYPNAPQWLSTAARQKRLSALDAEIAALEAAREKLK